jgi:CheY-like chemotaxis protein
VCTACGVPQPPDPESVEKAGGFARLPAQAIWMAGKGCAACGQSGYKGRLAVHELLQMSDELRGLVARRAPDYEIRKAARTAGMRTLMEDGVAKAAQGLTTLDEVMRVVAQDDITTPRVDRRAAPVEVTEAATSLAGERILIVEDSPTVVTVLKYFLELDGFQVLVADNGAAGLETAKREHPRVILTDVKMPGMDGMTMVKALRADAETRDIAIMMLTSESSVESEAEGLAAGADDYILKPVEPRRLAARVKALFTRLQARKTTSLAGANPPFQSDNSHDPNIAA